MFVYLNYHKKNKQIMFDKFMKNNVLFMFYSGC